MPSRRHPAQRPSGPDYTILAQTALYPGREYHDLTPAERVAVNVRALEDATAAGAFGIVTRKAQRAWRERRARELAGLKRAG